MIPHQQEQIDNYHSGLMSDEQASAFRSKLDADPSLKAESDLQGDIIKGLKEFRKAELKTRLDVINVSPTWIGFIQQSALVKSLGGVVVASLIGGSIYVLGKKETPSGEENMAPVDAPVAELITYDVIDLGEEPETIDTEKMTLDKPMVESRRSKEERSFNQLNDAASEEELLGTEDDRATTTDTKDAVFIPSVSVPDVALIEEGEGFQSSGLDKLPENASVNEAEKPIDVKSEQRKGSIKYKYYDGKLFLSGDFNKNTYEILEINSAAGRRIYVYYLSQYYSVGITDRLVELPKVTNQKMIEELELIRKNK